MKHRQVQHSTSTTHPICYAAARRLLRSLARKSARLASWAIGLLAAEIHIRGVHGNREDWDPMGPMGFPWEWE